MEQPLPYQPSETLIDANAALIAARKRAARAAAREEGGAARGQPGPGTADQARRTGKARGK